MTDQHGNTGKDCPSTFVQQFRICGADLVGRLRVLPNGCGDEPLSFPLTLGAVAGVPAWSSSRKELV